MHSEGRRFAEARSFAIRGIVALVLLTIIGLSYDEWRRYHNANAAAVQTRQIAAAADELITSLWEAETGQRGYLLTGESRYLEPYNLAVQAIPNELTRLKALLAERPGQAENAARLGDLTARKLAELRETIGVRRTRGAPAALAIVLSDQGKQSMDEIRALALAIGRSESAALGRASAEGEAAAATALLVTVAGAIVLLFLFAAGLEPFLGGGAEIRERAWWLRYGAAFVATAVAAVLRAAVVPLIGPTAQSFVTFLPVVLLTAWFGGLRPALLSVFLSAFTAEYFFTPPLRTFGVPSRDEQVAVLIFVASGVGIALLAQAQRKALRRAEDAENAERNERQRFETTLASIGDAVVATDASGRVTFVNPVAAELMKRDAAELAGRPLEEAFRIVNEYSRETVESPVAKVLQEGHVVGLANHTVLIARDGTEVPIDDSAAPIRDRQGDIIGAVLVFRDITMRRRAEQAAELLASIVESSNDAVISEDLNGIVTSWNRGAERIYGYSAAEMIGNSSGTLSPPGREDEGRGILEGIRQGERVEHFRTVGRTKSGAMIHVSLTVSPVRDGGGRITGASRIARDITAEVAAQAEIAEQRERLRVTLNSIGDAVLTTDTAGRVTYLNPVAERLTGWTSGAAAPRPLEEVFHILNEHTREPAENPVSKVLRDGQVAGLANHTVLIPRGGGEIAIDDSAAPILREEAGGAVEMLGVVLVFRDITERRRLERERLELAARERALAAEAALREKEAELARISRALTVGELAASIAHEVNQPLAGVVTNAEAGLRWLSIPAPDLEEVRQSLDLIVRDGNRASAVVRRIREFLRNENREMAPLDLNAAILESVALVEAELRRRRVALRLDLAPDLPPVDADAVQLQQVIANLMMNSSEAMAALEGARELVVSSRAAEGGVLVCVRDFGPGAAPADVQRIFEPFFTTKPMGMGMGLAISRSIVEAHGGTIWAEANVDQGLTVQFQIPAALGARA